MKFFFKNSNLTKFLLISITISQLSAVVYAMESCDEILKGNQGSPKFLTELRSLKRSVLESEDRTSRLLLEKTFNNKLSEVAKTLKISEKELSDLLSSGDDVPILTILKKQEKLGIKSEKNPAYQIISESFQKYEKYSEIKERAFAYFKKICIDKKSHVFPEVEFNPEKPSAPLLKLSYYAPETYSPFVVRAAFLAEALQEEFAEQAGITLPEPIVFNFKESDIPLALAINAEDMILTRAAYLFEVKTSLDPNDVYDQMPPLMYYLHTQENPKVEFIDFLVKEFDENILARDNHADNLVHVLLREPVNTNGETVRRDDMNTIKVLNYLYENSLQLFSTKNHSGSTPMNTSRITPAVLTWMINKGLDLNNQDNNGETLLIEAAKLELKEIVETLLKANADKTIKDKKGKTALDYARERNYTDLIERLK